VGVGLYLFVAADHVPRELLELGRAKVAGGNHLQQLAHRKTGIGIVGHFCKVLLARSDTGV